MRDHILEIPALFSEQTCPTTLNDRLEWLCEFGQPWISRHKEGWYAAIDMNTNTTGSSFKIATSFNEPTPESAVQELIVRMLNTLQVLRGGK